MNTSVRTVIRLGNQLASGSKTLTAPLRRCSSMIYNESGGVHSRPSAVRFGLVKVSVVTVPFLYLGATISKNGAAWLEENEIFVPEDDDD